MRQFYLSFKPKDDVIQTEALTRIQNCLIKIKVWMHQSMLKLNTKPRGHAFYIKHNPQFMDKVSVQVGNGRITSTICVRNLGVMLESNMTPRLRTQGASICRSGYAQLRSIGRIRRYLSNDATKSLVYGLVISGLDYCNALIHGLPDAMINKLQRVQNTAACIVTRTARHNHITPVLNKLHWLPVKYRAQFKLLVHTHKALHDRSPVYATIGST